MLADRRQLPKAHALWCAAAAVLLANAALAQQQPPSGAVRSHYAPRANAPIVVPTTNNTISTPPQASPTFVPATRIDSSVTPASNQTHLQDPVPFSTRSAAPAPIPLSPRGSSNGKALIRTPTSGWGAVSSVGASLGVVLGAFLCVAWLSKRYLPKSAGPLPKEVVEQLGWAPLTGRQQMQLVRLGNKLLLIAVTPGSGAEPLGEVTDEAEVERLSAICRRTKPESSTHTFREVINELERQPARGFVDTQARQNQIRPAASSSASSTALPRPTIARPLNG